jgi:hypothetical protein
MSEHQISPDHEVRGHPFELWSTGTCQPGMYPDWYLATNDPEVAKACGVALNTVLTADEFTPPLTMKEIESIGETVLGYLTQ